MIGVGAVVAVHGWTPYLFEALESLAEADEVVVVDDGSREPLALAPDAVGPGGPALRLVRSERREGLARARARGEALLASEWVAFCDADDAWTPGSLALRRDALAAQPEAAVCFGGAVIVGPDGRATGERRELPPAGVYRGSELAPRLYERNFITASGAMVRRSALHDAGGLASDLPAAEDWDLWLRLARADALFVCVAEAVVRYRRHPDAMTADVALIARAQRVVHEAHAELVDSHVRETTRVSDLRGLAAGLVREGRYREARAALAAVPGSRARRAMFSVPLVRGLLGRRDPYRHGR